MVKAQIKPFSGEIDETGYMEDPEMWLDQYEDICNVNGWDVDTVMLRNVSVSLIGEASTWYSLHREDIREDWEWSDFRHYFINRFRSTTYVEELEERVLNPVQKNGESVTAYAERYQRLVNQMGDDAPTESQVTKYWVSGLKSSIKLLVRINKPRTFHIAKVNAITVEQAECAQERDEAKTIRGIRPEPLKGRSGNIAESTTAANQAAGLQEIPRGVSSSSRPLYASVSAPMPRRSSIEETSVPEDDPRYLDFFQALGEDTLKDGDRSDLHKRFDTWKAFSKIEKDPYKIKNYVLRDEENSRTKTATSRLPQCEYCKKYGHIVTDCRSLKYKKSMEAAESSASTSSPATTTGTVKCYNCGKEGHMARDCKASKPGDSSKKSDDKTSAKKTKTTKSPMSKKPDDPSTSYMAKASKRDCASSQMAKTRKQSELDKDGDFQFDFEPPKSSRRKTRVKNLAEKTVDQEVVATIRNMPIPLGLVVRHGASFESQAKKAIKQVYAEGRNYRKNLNPLAKTVFPPSSSSKFSHALVVSGYLGKERIPCERLVIDPGCSISMIDVRTARKGPLELNRDSHLTFHLANGEIARPVGETKQRQVINVEGVEVSLKMPVVDSKDSYDILLGRDWLHAVNAVARYAKNQYKISRDGKHAKLQGRIYTQREVELASSSTESSSSDSDSDSESNDDSDEEDEPESLKEPDTENEEEPVEQFLAACVRLDDLDIKPPVEVLKVARREPEATVPVRMTEGSAGYDLFASKDIIVPAKDQVLVPTGISVEIPEGCYGQIKPRSGLAFKKQITTDAGVIDRDYRGEVFVLLVNRSEHDFSVNIGDRIAQLVLVKIATPDIQEVAILQETDRGEGGLGSTGASLSELPDAKILQPEDLGTLNINPHLSLENRVAGEELLWEFRDLFVTNVAEMGNTHIAQHEINLKPGATPYYCPGFKRYAPAELKALKDNIEEELASGKIVQMDGPWCAPIVISKKKDGSFRKCVAYIGLNDRTERESWPLPNVEELLERAAGHKWYTACDGFMGFYAVKIKEEDIFKTVFRTPFGTYAYTVMPFGLKNAPHTFSKVTYRTYSHLIGKTVEAYIDDTATYSDTFEQHLFDLRKTFEATRASGLKLKAKKCFFFYPEVEFIGHLIGEYGIKMMPGKIDRVKNWPQPTDRTQVKAFLGLASYYRRFVKDFAHVAVPLNRLTSKSARFDWTKKEQRSFDALKQALITAPVLAKPDFEKEWTLDVDASQIALGAVLGQKDDNGDTHPIYYWSRQLGSAERNYSTTDRECLAVVAAMRKFRPYVLGSHVTIVGDHSAVKWIFNKIDISGRHARWKVILSEFDYEIVSRPGVSNQNADALSRIPNQKEEEVNDDDLTFRTAALNTKWADDPWYKRIYLYLEISAYDGATKAERETTRRKAMRFFVRKDVLFYRDTDGGAKICLGGKDVKMVLREYHDGAPGGHFGRDLTINNIRRNFWWPALWKDTSDYVKTCDICQRYGPKEHNNPLQPYRPIMPFEYIFIDYIVNLPLTTKRNRHIITMTEGLTKWVEAKATRNATAKESASFLMDSIVCRFGVPLVIITDNGSHFKGEFDDLCTRLGTQHRFATAYHPQTVGQDERTNGLLLGRTRKWRLEEYRKWDEDLPSSVFSCNTRKISTTNFSPIEVLMGYTASTSLTLRLGGLSKRNVKRRLKLLTHHTQERTPVQSRLRALDTLREEAIRVRDIKAVKMKERYDKKTRIKPFEEGQEVLLYDSSLLKQWSRKLEERWNGPYTILWKGDHGAYTIDLGNGKTRTVSGDHLKLYHRRQEIQLQRIVRRI